MGDPTAFVYVTPDEFLARMDALGVDPGATKEQLQDMANAPDQMCEVCGVLPAWKYGGLGICFPCTTGETDASEDFELLPESEGSE